MPLDIVYRFRSIDKLIGKKELERNEMRLASPSELNDPMEGYKDVVWHGDVILWENLLRHYILMFLSRAMDCLLLGGGSSDDPAIPAAVTEDDLPTDVYRGIYREACSEFFKRPGVVPFLAVLTKLRLRREGVTLVLGLMHQTVFVIVLSVMKKSGVFPPETVGLTDPGDKLGNTLSEFEEALAADGEDFETVAFAMNRVREQQSLVSLVKFDKVNAEGAGRLRYLLYAFPELYIQSAVDKLVHPPWQTVCFSANCTNASMWGVYGNGHSGVALAFRPQLEGGRPFIPFTGITGTSWVKGQPTTYTRGAMKGYLDPVTYSERAPEIDFFQSLGNLPKGKLERAWHTNQTGERSKLVDDMLSDLPTWRRSYLEAFRRVATTKHPDWKHEEEYRIVMIDAHGMRANGDHRLIQYDFASLVGIVFGLRTSEAHKLELIKLITSQCDKVGRKDFAFYQMGYDAAKGRLVRV